MTQLKGTFILNTDAHLHFPSVPKDEVVHGKPHFILIVLAKRVHTEHGTSRQSTDGNLTLVRDILFPSVGICIGSLCHFIVNWSTLRACTGHITVFVYLLLFYALATVSQLFPNSYMIYEMSRRKPEPTLLLTFIGLHNCDNDVPLLLTTGPMRYEAVLHNCGTSLVGGQIPTCDSAQSWWLYSAASLKR